MSRPRPRSGSNRRVDDPRARERPSPASSRPTSPPPPVAAPEGLAGAHLVPGERAIVELLRAAPRRVRRLFVVAGRQAPELMALAAEVGVRIEAIDEERLTTIVPPALARGMIALADPPPEHDVDDLIAGPDDVGRQVLVALDGVVDPHNLGAILRSAEFFGARGALWPRDRAVGLTPAAVRASAGASERLPIARVVNLARALERCQGAGYWVVGTVVDDGRPLREIWEKGAPERVVVVFGGEERGLRRLTRERCDVLATIPRTGAIGSLNVSAAAAVTLAEICAD